MSERDPARLTPAALDRLERAWTSVDKDFAGLFAEVRAARESTPAPTEALVIAAARVEHEMRICADMNGGGAEEDWADVLAEGLAADVAARTAPASEVPTTNAEVERAHRNEWADYIDNWDGAVGPEPPTVRSIVAALRRPSPPFGVAAADRIEAGA